MGTDAQQHSDDVLCNVAAQELQQQLSDRLQNAPLQTPCSISNAAVHEAPQLAPYAVVRVSDACSATQGIVMACCCLMKSLTAAKPCASCAVAAEG
jgi:hypothetical protein